MKIILDIAHYSYENAGFHTINLVENWVSELVNGISRIFSDEDLRNSCMTKGIERAKSFTWERCAMETLKAFNEVYDGNVFLSR
jgi:glycosyltransferase involved in cell wall biosynthesis